MRKLNLQKLIKGAMMLSAASMILLASCAKDGNDGAQGPAGANGKDASETCKLCHNPAVVDSIATQFQLSKHEFGTTAEEEAGNTGCTPCHCQEAFKYVCKNNISTAFTFNSTTGKWENPYATVASSAYGALGCFTCHSNLHTNYAYADLTTFTTVAPVAMTMWGGLKTIDLQQDGGKSNLCVKCHQPRPSTVSLGDGRLFPYDTLISQASMIFWDSAYTAVNKFIKPSYRMHNHYGAVGAIYAGKGAIEYLGSKPYANVSHTTLASCENCHMAPISGAAGGHSFKARGNFNGCNVSGCHSAAPLTANSSKVTNAKKTIIVLLNQLAAKINAWGGTHDLLHVDATSSNLWLTYNTDGASTATKLTKSWDGYLDVYDASTNPSGYWKFQNSTYTVSPSQVFPTLKMVQFGAIINFQLCLREYSLGLHNFNYSEALLTNTIEKLTALGL